MKDQYTPPEFKKSAFHCMQCQAYSHQYWRDIYARSQNTGSYETINSWMYCICKHCGEISYWHNEKLLVPDNTLAEPPHPDLPEACKADYEEASGILSKSPKASAALLRLCIQRLVIELGCKGKNLNDDIGALVEQGLPTEVQQALDICRVIGNESVHPGEINVNDTPEIANKLFTMINFIVEDRITKPKELKELYESLPERKLKQIEQRDNSNKKESAVKTEVQ